MTINALHKYFLKCNSVSTDTRQTTENSMFFAIRGANFDGNKFAEDALKKGASYAVIDNIKYKKGNQYLLVKDVLTTLQELASFHRTYLKLPIIALTGSNGKTTTKELINTVLSKAYKTKATVGNLNNHIGVPLTLLSMDDTCDIGIVEMGANHQNEIDFLSRMASPDYGLITNFGKAHLEGFGGFEGVIKGKTELYDYLKSQQKIIFVNKNDDLQVKQAAHYKKNVYFGSNTVLMESQPYITLKYKKAVIKTKLTGSYNYHNICVAIAIGAYFKVPKQKIIYALENYIPSNNRSEVLQQNGHQIILDAYNANPSSMIAALTNFEKLNHANKVVILGDMFELGEFAQAEHQYISDEVNKFHFEKMIFVGAHFNNISSKHKNSIYYETYDALVNDFSNFKFKNQLFLIKGSRGMALERLLRLI